MTEASYLVGRPADLPEDVACQRCHEPSRTLALVWKIKSLRDAPLDEDGRRYYCPGCVAWLGPRGQLIPPPDELEQLYARQEAAMAEAPTGEPW